MTKLEVWVSHSGKGTGATLVTDLHHITLPYKKAYIEGSSKVEGEILRAFHFEGLQELHMELSNPEKKAE